METRLIDPKVGFGSSQIPCSETASAVRLALGRERCRGLWSLRSCHSHLATVPLQLELVWEPSAGSMPHPIPEHSSSSIRDDSSMVTRNITTDVMARALGSLFLGG